MIRDYEIHYIDKTEVLYVYLDFNSEFAKVNFKKNNKDLKKYIEDFIVRNKIKFNGFKVFILVSGVIIGTLYLNNDKLINNYNNSINYVIPVVKEQQKIVDVVEERFS